MKKLSKGLIQERDHLVRELEEKRQALQEAVDDYNAKLQELNEELDGPLQEFNQACENLETWRQAIHEEQESFYEERSENWQDGERGQAYSEWKDQYEEEIRSDHELEFPNDLEMPAEADDIPDVTEWTESPEG